MSVISRGKNSSGAIGRVLAADLTAFPLRSFLATLLTAVYVTLAFAPSLNAQSVMPAGSPLEWWREFPRNMYLIYSPRGATSYHLTPTPETWKDNKRTIGGPYESRTYLELDRTRLVNEKLLIGKDFALIYVWDGRGRGLGTFCLGRKVIYDGPSNRSIGGTVDASLDPVGPCRAEAAYPLPVDLDKHRRDLRRLRDEGPYPVPGAIDFTFGSLQGRVTITAPNGKLLVLKQEHLKYLSLLPGDHLTTGPNASASITGPGAEFRLDRDSDIRISSLTVGNPVWESSLLLKSGEVSAAIVSGARLEIDTPTAASSVRGTIFRSRFDAAQQANTVSVQEGEVLVTPKNRSLEPVVVRAGSQVRVTNKELIKPGDPVPSAQTNRTAQGRTAGGRPHFFWAQYQFDLDFDGCANRARSALSSANLGSIESQVLPGGRIQSVGGTNQALNAWITCNRAVSPTLFTVMVAGSSGRGRETEDMKNYLRDYMLGATGSDDTATDTGELPSGKWTSRDWGKMDFQSRASGLLATYKWVGGVGDVYGTIANRYLDGHWVQKRAEKRCDVEKLGSFYWGRFNGTFNETVDKVEGSWSYCSDPSQTKEWEATKDACATAPSGVLTSDSFKTMTFQCRTSGLLATYSLRGGKIYGSITNRKLVGYWVQTIADRKCDTERNGSLYWGRVEGDFNRNFDQVVGKWSYCDTEPRPAWSGNR